MRAFVTRFFLVPAGVVLLAGMLAGGADARDVKPAAMKSSKHTGAPTENVETRIKTLHAQLRITPEQESAFQNVAQVMRDNESALKPLREQKADAVESANALDQLNSYAALIDAHAAGVHKFVPAFQTLYDGLSPEQKKAADVAFREKARQATKRGKL